MRSQNVIVVFKKKGCAANKDWRGKKERDQKGGYAVFGDAVQFKLKPLESKAKAERERECTQQPLQVLHRCCTSAGVSRVSTSYQGRSPVGGWGP